MISLDFSGSNAQTEGGQNMISTTAPCLSDISSAMRGVR